MSKVKVERVELTDVESQPQENSQLSGRDYDLVKDVNVDVDVELGKLEISIEKLFSLKAGEVISLDKEVNEPVNLVLNDQVVAKGNLVAVDGFFGVEITSIQE